MGAIELLEVHSVAGLLEVGDQASAGSLEGQDLVLCAMGYKDTWIAPLCAVEIEHERSRIRRRGGDVQESVTVEPQIEGSDARLGAATGRSDRPGAQPNRGFGTRAGGHESGEKDSASRLLAQTFGKRNCSRFSSKIVIPHRHTSRRDPMRPNCVL